MKFRIFIITMTLSLLFIASPRAEIPVTESGEHEAIKADIINQSPSSFTIDVFSWDNLWADKDASTFALYVTSYLPDQCGDLRSFDLSYQRPSKYKRIFDLSENPEVLEAVDTYGCIVVKNTPPG